MPAASVRSSSRRSNRPPAARLPRNGTPIAHAFFLAERDHVDAERQPPPAQRLHGRDAEQDAQHAVVFAGIGHGVEVRADRQHRQLGSKPVVTPDQVPRRIEADAQPGRFHPPASRSCSRRIGSLRKVRVILPGSSENEAT